jgi:hypothetical protein
MGRDLRELCFKGVCRPKRPCPAFGESDFWIDSRCAKCAKWPISLNAASLGREINSFGVPIPKRHTASQEYAIIPSTRSKTLEKMNLAAIRYARGFLLPSNQPNSIRFVRNRKRLA